MKEFPVIKTSRLVLNEAVADDATAIFNMFSDPDVVEFYDFEVFKDQQQALKLIESDHKGFLDNQSLRWAIREKDTGLFIGGCGINRFISHNHVAVISYEFCKSSWGKGFATEAVNAMIKFAFSDQSPQLVNRIEANTMLGNDGSEGMLKKLGFEFEGVMREYGFWKGQYHDLKLFALIKRDFQTLLRFKK